MAPSHGLAVDVAGPRVTLRARLLPDTRSATVQARSKDDVRVLVPGRFTPTNGARTLDCDDRDDSAITHVDNTEKTNVTAKWAAPPGWEGSVVFKATVVKKYEACPEYVFSDHISIRKAYETVQASSDDEWLTMATELKPNGSIQPLPVMAPTQTPCHAGVEVVNHLASRITRATARQGKATVIDCFLYDGTPGMQESWNTDTMQNMVQTPTSAGITFGTHGVVDGLLRCAWNRKNVTIAQGKTFDIGKEKYYLLLASGPFLVDAATGKPTSQEKQMHTIRGLTATPLLLAQAYEVKQKEEDFLPYKIHGKFPALSSLAHF
ncbi:hypothetical protein MRX96_031411 [Rhipicephalus microplus]